MGSGSGSGSGSGCVDEETTELVEEEDELTGADDETVLELEAPLPFPDDTPPTPPISLPLSSGTSLTAEELDVGISGITTGLERLDLSEELLRLETTSETGGSELADDTEELLLDVDETLVCVLTEELDGMLLETVDDVTLSEGSDDTVPEEYTNDSCEETELYRERSPTLNSSKLCS